MEGISLGELESAVKADSLKIAGRILQQKLNTDNSDYRGPSLPCQCGGTARYVGRRPKNVTSVLGDLILERAYYHCSTCGTGFSPRDRALGLDQGSLSPGVTRMVALVGANTSFEDGAHLLAELAGVSIDAKLVERTAERIGEAVARDEILHAEPVSITGRVMYVGVDGTGIPMRREELLERPGKQPDGSAKTREVKVCTVWETDAANSENAQPRKLGSTSYTAAIESAAWNEVHPEYTPPFAQRVERELNRRGFFQAETQVFIGDGARWVWNLAEMIAPGAIQIVDLYHAKEHLSALGSLLFSPGTDLARKWSADRHLELEIGNLDAVLNAIGQFSNLPGDKGAAARREQDYFVANRHRMDYARFRSMGLSVGSGVLEAGCRVVVGQRLKRSGMFWSVRGANQILALRSSMLSGTFDAFWNRYITARRSIA